MATGIDLDDEAQVTTDLRRSPSDGAAPSAGRAGLATVVASVAAAVLPVVVATIRAVHGHWLAIGDNGYFALRSRDVFSHHAPLLGTWTSASQSSGIELNNPGPLFFDLLAVPTKLFNDAGLASAVAAINIAAIIGIAVVAYRRGGAVPATAATAMAAGLSWTMGSELLFDPWQPHSMLLPFLFFIVLVWSLVCGDFAVLPVAVGVASLVFQTHLSYAVLVPMLALWGVGALAWRMWDRRRADPDNWPALRRRLRRPLVASAIVALVCWLQPAIEQLQHGRDGNLTSLLRSLRTPKTNVGWSFGTRLVSTVVALPPWWGRPSFGDDFLPRTDAGPIAVVEPPTTARAVASLFVVVGALALCIWWARRRRDVSTAAAAATAIIGVLGALLTAASLPVGLFGIAAHQLRWLWPVAVFATFAVVLTIARTVAERTAPLRVVSGLTVASLLFGVMNVPAHNQGVGPSADAAAIAPTRDLISQLGPLDGEHTFLLRIAGLRFAEPWDTPIMNELDRRGYEIVVDDPAMVRQLGPERAFGGRADGRLLILEGDAALSNPVDARRIALHVDLDAAEQHERLQLQQDIGAHLASGGFRLTPAGERAAAAGSIPALPVSAPGQPPDPRALLVGDRIRDLLANGWIQLEPPWDVRFARYADLQHRWNFLTVAVFVAPVDAQP